MPGLACPQVAGGGERMVPTPVDQPDKGLGSILRNDLGSIVSGTVVNYDQFYRRMCVGLEKSFQQALKMFNPVQCQDDDGYSGFSHVGFYLEIH